MVSALRDTDGKMLSYYRYLLPVRAVSRPAPVTTQLV